MGHYFKLENEDYRWGFFQYWTHDERVYYGEVVCRLPNEWTDFERSLNTQNVLTEYSFNGVSRVYYEDSDGAHINTFYTQEKSFFFNGKGLVKAYFNKNLDLHYKEIMGGYWQDGEVFFTPNSFKVSAQKPLKSELYNVYCIALDIDYKKNLAYSARDPESFFWDMVAPCCGSVIPTPNYIEYSNQLRMIYTLQEPIRIYQKKNNMLHTVEILLKRLSNALNEEVNCHCEPQKVSSYFRMPGSINSKGRRYEVHVKKISSVKWTIQEIMNEFLPDVPEWYTNWVNKNKNTKKVQLHNSYVLWKNRLDVLEGIVSNPNINRENTCFIYAQALLWLNDSISYEDLMDKVYDYNDRLINPLPRKELRSKLNSLKISNPHKFKNSTIAEFIGVDLDIPASTAKAEARQRAKEKTAEKRSIVKNELIRLINEGKTNQEISTTLHMSVRQIQRLKKKNVNL